MVSNSDEFSGNFMAFIRHMISNKKNDKIFIDRVMLRIDNVLTLFHENL